MKNAVKKFYEFLGRPLYPSARLVLALLVVPLVLSFWFPLWRISMEAPQYPEGLSLDIYSYSIQGGHDGQDLKEINILNHYIGMHKLDRQELSDLDWIPFALGVLGILALRVAAIGDVRSLIDLVVVTGYVSAFSLARFVFKMWSYGHHLNPDAPVKVKGFTPALFGSKQVANFMTHSYPQAGTYLIGVFATGIVGLSLWHLVSGRRAAQRAEKLGLTAPSSEPSPSPEEPPSEPASAPEK